MTRKSEAGQALVLGLVILSLFLIGLAGLGIDMGYMRYEKRLMQTAADAAAIAGASNLAFSGVTAAGQAAATANGFTDSSSNKVSTCTNDAPTTKATKPPTVCVQINNGPTSGPHNGDTNYVEAYVSVVEPTFFMTLLGTYSEPVTARAVATTLSGVNSNCLYLLGPSPAGLLINGGGSKGGIQAPTCGVVDNGDFASGNSANWSMSAGSFSVAGSDTGGKGNVTCSTGQSPCPAYGVPAAGNPLAAFTPPAVGTPKAWVNGDGPGTYSSMSLGNSTLTLPSGIYVIDGSGGFSCGGNAQISGTGVMFYLTNGAAWSCGGTATVNLTAPSASTCPACPSEDYGILIYQDPTDHNADTISGGGHGNPNGGLGGLVVIWGITMNGNVNLTLGGTAGYGMTAVKDAVLVE